MINTSELKAKFTELFGQGDEVRLFFAPGRVNLIGEHIDYNGGHVFPAALTVGITAVIRPNDSDTVRMLSLNIPGEVSLNLKEKIEASGNNWGNYPKGVISYLIKEGNKLSGCDILFHSTLPDGAGLSSSAALEVLIAYTMLKIADEEIDNIKIAKLCQQVENEFIKVNCGIMDQFSIAMGKENCAILLDCDTLHYSYVPLDLGDYSLVILNTNKKRELAESKYNERKNECDLILNTLNKYIQVPTLCSANLEQVNKYIENGVLKKRAKHVITENKRVFEAMTALNKKDLKQFGLLLTQSHHSLKHSYEVSGFELDTIVEEALKIKGCIGARMTGAGFGGCAIAIVRTESLESFKKEVFENYKTITGIAPSFYESKIGEGVKELELARYNQL
jgi:galactokinase